MRGIPIEQINWDNWFKAGRRYIMNVVCGGHGNLNEAEEAAQQALFYVWRTHVKTGINPNYSYYMKACKHSFYGLKRLEKRDPYNNVDALNGGEPTDSMGGRTIGNDFTRMIEDRISYTVDEAPCTLDDLTKIANQHVKNPEYAKKLAAWANGDASYESIKRIVHILRKNERYVTGERRYKGSEWHDDAILLHDMGVAPKEIAHQLGRQYRTVHKALERRRKNG